MDKEVYEVILANWKQLILQCQNRPAGMTQKNWLEQHNILASQFYYWLRKVRREALAEMPDADNKEVVPTSIAGNDLAAYRILRSEVRGEHRPGCKSQHSLPRHEDSQALLHRRSRT